MTHVRSALPEIHDVSVAERPEDKHKYLTVTYEGGHVLPSWRVSDGTLRLLALTLIAYLPTRDTVYLIEEPENGIHPQALEAVYQSLSSCFDNQVFVATHSPVFLGIVPVERFLLLKKVGGASRAIHGKDHPVLAHWHHEVDIGTLFASGILT